MNNPYQQVAQDYHKTEFQDQVHNASPHKLINMLFDGAKKNIDLAKNQKKSLLQNILQVCLLISISATNSPYIRQ